MNWYVRDDLIDELQAIADSTQTSVGEVRYSPQYNDLSVPFGGCSPQHIEDDSMPWQAFYDGVNNIHNDDHFHIRFR